MTIWAGLTVYLCVSVQFIDEAVSAIVEKYDNFKSCEIFKKKKKTVKKLEKLITVTYIRRVFIYTVQYLQGVNLISPENISKYLVRSATKNSEKL